MESAELAIVEHIDTGSLTLHRANCPVLKRVTITHPGTTLWLAQVDRKCKMCKPEVDIDALSYLR